MRNMYILQKNFAICVSLCKFCSQFALFADIFTQLTKKLHDRRVFLQQQMLYILFNMYFYSNIFCIYYSIWNFTATNVVSSFQYVFWQQHIFDFLFNIYFYSNIVCIFYSIYICTATYIHILYFLCNIYFYSKNVVFLQRKKLYFVFNMYFYSNKCCIFYSIYIFTATNVVFSI